MIDDILQGHFHCSEGANATIDTPNFEFSLNFCIKLVRPKREALGAEMKIGMCMFLWATRIGSEHATLLSDIAATGFDGVEIPVFEGVGSDYRLVAGMLDSLDLQRTAVTAIGDPKANLISAERQVRQRGIDYMRWAIDMTSELGATRLSGPLHSTLGHFSGAGPTEQEMDWAVESQIAIGQYAEQAGVTICLEALNRFECYLVNTMSDLCALLARIDNPNIRAMYDTFHANIEEADPIAAYSDHANWVSHIHISENDRGVPGRGNIPWIETFQAIAASGYDDWLTIESFGRGLPDLAAATKVWRDFAESPEAVYRDGYIHIKNSMQAAGLA